jgi:predicted transcriptional regulator
MANMKTVQARLNLDSETHRKLKLLAIERRMKLQEVLQDAVHGYVEKNRRSIKRIISHYGLRDFSGNR